MQNNMDVLSVGDSAVLVDLDSLDSAMVLFQALNKNLIPGVFELVPAAKTILISFDNGLLGLQELKSWLSNIAAFINFSDYDLFTNSADLVEIPVVYDGQDLNTVADFLNISVSELIDRHTGSEFIAAFAGFAPGFVYLSKGDPSFKNIPRLGTPRTRVPASSVALAGDFSAIYPKDSPGGWQLLGTTTESMWDLNRAKPALIRPGDRVRFQQLVDRKTHILGVSPKKYESNNVDTNAALGNYLEIISPGVQTLIQDYGRRGLTSLGVSNSGALDRLAMQTANLLVGNSEDTAVLENALGNLHLKFHCNTYIAIVGADTSVILTTESGMRIPAAANSAIRVSEGNILKLGSLRSGMRVYVAIKGGFAVKPILDSWATDILAGLGPEPLRKGDKLPLVGAKLDRISQAQLGGAQASDRSNKLQTYLTEIKQRKLPKAHEIIELDVILGPRNDWFTEQAIVRLTEQSWLVSSQSNRVGLRLNADLPLERRNHNELPSEGTVAGAIQVPASGQPVLFLADHPLTGGYPVIAVLASKYLDLAGQIPVGALLRFSLVQDKP